MRYIISKEYSKETGLRYCDESDFSGEDFYHKKLNQLFVEAYNKGDNLELNLDTDSVDGFGPSFLDEAIGNLVYDFSLEIVEKILSFSCIRGKLWIDMIKTQTYKNWETRRKDKKEPTVTEKHPAWYRVVGGQLECKVWINPKS